MARFQSQGLKGAAGYAKGVSQSVAKGFGKHKVLYTAAGLAGAGMLGAQRRGPGTSKVHGRPTGIYKY